MQYWVGMYIDHTEISQVTDLEERRKKNWKWFDGTRYDYQNGIGWYDEEPRPDKTVVRLIVYKWAANDENIPLLNHFICEASKQILHKCVL